MAELTQREVRLLARKRKRIRRSANEIVALGAMFVVIFVWCMTFVYVLFWTIQNSLKTPVEFYVDTFGFGKDPQWRNYIRAFTDITYNNTPMYAMIWNTIWMAFLGAFVNIAASALVAYSVTKFRYPGRTLIYSIAIFVQVVPLLGAGSAAYKLHVELGLINNPYLIWISWASGFDFAFLVLYGYFKSVSDAYSEAAEIDGAGELRIMLRVVLPQAAPAILSLMLLQLIGMWNNYNISLIYMKKYPSMALGLFEFQEMKNFSGTGDPTYLAAVIWSMIPVFIVFAGFQKTIMNNVSVGGLKG